MSMSGDYNYYGPRGYDRSGTMPEYSAPYDRAIVPEPAPATIPEPPRTPVRSSMPGPISDLRHPSTGDMLRPKPAGAIIVLGVLIFFIGMLLLQSATLLEVPEYEDFESSDYDVTEKKYDDARETWEDQVRNLVGIGRICNWLGAMVIVLPLYIVGIGSERVDWKIRATMVSTATAVVITAMIVTIFYWVPSI